MDKDQLQIKELLQQLELLKNENKQLKNLKKFGLVWEENFDEKEKMYPIIESKNNGKLDFINNENKPINYLIEGDNYESLKILNYTHKETIDLIYIDPPYNTGNKDFIYNDKIVDLNDGYRHSKWLSFMNKRLKLAKELLTEDGVIFISIDDNEVHRLRMICEEIFGEKNVEQLIWNKEAEGKSGSLKQVKRFRGIHEYIIVCYKNINNVVFNKVKEAMENPTFQTANLAKTVAQKRKISDRIFEIKAPNGKVWVDEWKFSKEDIQEFILNNRLYFGKSGDNKPRLIIETGENREIYQTSIINKGSTSQGQNDFDTVFESNKFSYPKPLNLIKHLIKLICKKDIIVLDFFAGSGTTGQAVQQLNKEDGQNRSYILCTNNENNICEEITYERLARINNPSYYNLKSEELKNLSHNLKYLKIKEEDVENIKYIKNNQGEYGIFKYLSDSMKEIIDLKEMSQSIKINDNLFYIKNKYILIIKNRNDFNAIKSTNIDFKNKEVYMISIDNELWSKKLDCISSYLPEQYINELKKIK